MSYKLHDLVVLDTSVIIKWFRHHEILCEQALSIRQNYLDGDLSIHVPELLICEIANVLRYKPDICENEVQQALQSLFDMKIPIERISTAIINRAIEIAYSHDITIYDAIFVALAWRLEADFITADQKLIKKLHDIPYIRYLADFTH